MYIIVSDTKPIFVAILWPFPTQKTRLLTKNLLWTLVFVFELLQQAQQIGHRFQESVCHKAWPKGILQMTINEEKSWFQAHSSHLNEI